MKGGRNHEGYQDPTASAAIGNVIKEGKVMRINWYDKNNDPLAEVLRIQKEKRITKREAEKIVREMMPKESDFQKKIKEAILEAYPDAFTAKIQQAQYSQGGIPDLMVIIRGHYFGFEVKKPYFHKKSSLQIRTIKWITEAGGTAAFISYPSEALDIIEEYFKN